MKGIDKYTYSVLQDWVMQLPLREQGTLLTGVRGCDIVPKEPLDSTARQLVAFFRYCVMNPVDPREVDLEPGVFFQSRPPSDWRASELGHYPVHWYAHLMHCFEVVGYRCPHEEIAAQGYYIYSQLVYGLHLVPEPKNTMIHRLSEDRIALGNVVS